MEQGEKRERETEKWPNQNEINVMLEKFNPYRNLFSLLFVKLMFLSILEIKINKNEENNDDDKEFFFSFKQLFSIKI